MVPRAVQPSASRRARAAPSAASTRSGAVPPMTSQLASAPSISAAARTVVPIVEVAGKLPGLRVVAGRERRRDRVVVERLEPDAGGLGLGDQRADDVMGGSERDAAADERVRDGRCGRVALGGGRPHARPVDGERLEHAGQHAEAGLVDADGPEQRRLVLLQVALVREGEALEDREDRGQRRDRPGGAATDELGGIRVLLVGHDRAAGRERVRRPHEPEPRVRPPGELLRQPAEVHHPERHGGEHLDDEVAVGDGVERVRGDAVEAELRCGRLAVERVARAREGAGPSGETLSRRRASASRPRSRSAIST